MAAVRDVEIDPEGTFKYILVRLQRPGGGEQRDIVRGTKAAEFHSGCQAGAGEAVSGACPQVRDGDPGSQRIRGEPLVCGGWCQGAQLGSPPPHPVFLSHLTDVSCKYEKRVDVSVRCHFQA